MGLFLARAVQGDLTAPYDWVRAWQPWHATPPSFDYAHPPLHWLLGGLARRVLAGADGAPPLPLLRAVVTLPPALLLAWAVGRLAARLPVGGMGAVSLWIASPVTILALASGFMPDLLAVALGTAGVVAWQEGVGAGRRSGAWFALAGLLLAGAALTKYPALLLVGVVLLHGLRRGLRGRDWPAWLVFAVAWGGAEAWLALRYGRFHLLEALGTAGDIARGPLSWRALGTASRLGIAVAPVVFLLPFSGRTLVPSALGAVGLLVWAGPEELTLSQTALLLAATTAGLASVLLAARSLVGPHAGTTAAGLDRPLLGLWVLAVILGVALGHNYASGRYLLPAVAPLACLLAAGLPGLGIRRVVTAALTGGWMALAGGALAADTLYAEAAEALADDVASRYPPGWFSGEWTFRWRLESAGWRAWPAPNASSPGPAPGDLVVTLENGVAGVLPWEKLEVVEALESPARFPLRLVDVRGNVGYYAETLGPLPVGWSRGPMETARILRVTPGQPAP